MDDPISRQMAIDAMVTLLGRVPTNAIRAKETIEKLPSVKEKPFNLPEIHIAEGYDTIEGEDGNVGFGVYIPDENQIYVAGDVENEIRTKALLHEICHWVQDMCGRPFDEDEANRFAEAVYNALPSAQPERILYADMSDAEFEKWLYEHGICNPNIHESIPCDAVPLLIDNAISELPSAQPRMKGGWVKGINENGVTTSLFCSECNYENKHWYEWNYCPNCGADMKGD